MNCHNHDGMGGWGIFHRMGRKRISLFILALALSGGPSHSQSLATTETSDTTPDPRLETLAKARKSVERFFEQSANLTCTERVTQSILDYYGRSTYEEHSLFNYRFKADRGSKSLQFVESRERLQAPFRDPSRTLLITDGFGNMLLILHPAYQASYTFEADGDEVIGGVTTIRFRFKSVPDASSPIMIQIRGQNYPVALSGTVWIEEQSGNVVKLSASSDSDMNELGVSSMSSDIQYIPVAFHHPDESYWMPASAVIDVATEHRHWRNVHIFSAYKIFDSVTTATNPRENQ
jgi:hypothetical protein